MTKAPISRETQTPEVSSTQLMRTIPQLRLRSFFSQFEIEGTQKSRWDIHLCKNQKVKRIFWRVRKMVFRRSRVGNLPALLPQKKWEEKSLDLEQVLRGYLVLCITPGSPFLYHKKRWEAKSLDLEQERVLCGYLVLCVTPGSPPPFLLPPKEVGSKDSGSRARVVRVFGFLKPPVPSF
jgi:hypothetical protein